jgi:disulfide oxidoreductase YuzD
MSFGCIPVISQKCHMDMLEDTIFNKFINQNNDSKTYIAMFNSLVHEESLTMLHNQAQEVIKKYDRNTQAQKYLDIINML